MPGPRRDRDLDLAAELAAGKTVAEAAAAAGVSERTAYRRKNEPDFQAKVRRLRDELLDRVAAKLGQRMSRAADADYLWWLKRLKRGGAVRPLDAADRAEVEALFDWYSRTVREAANWPAEPPDDFLPNFINHPPWYPADHVEMDRHYRQRTWE